MMSRVKRGNRRESSPTAGEAAARPRASIGLIPCLAFAVGTTVGGGVFTLSGTAINDAGPAALLSYLIAGVVMFLSALCFVAVAGRARAGDSGYGPIGEILSPVWRFVVMWGFYLNALMMTTFLLVSFGNYLNEYFIAGLGAIAAALIAIVGLTALNLGPADVVGRTETLVVTIKIGLLLLFACWGLAALKGGDLKPFAPEGGTAVLNISALLFTAYTGFNVVTNMAASVRKPERTVPLAVMLSVGISALVYVGVVLAMLASGVQHFGDAGVGQAANALMGDWGGYLIAFAACLSTLSGANANVLGASEIMLRLVAQGDVPPAAGRTTRAGHPLMSVLLYGGVSILFILLADFHQIVVVANVGALVAMIVVNAAAFRLALRGWPGKGMRLPGGVAIPVIATVACLIQFPYLELSRLLLGLALIAAGMLIYAIRHEQRLGAGVVERVVGAILDLETPLARALRRLER